MDRQRAAAGMAGAYHAPLAGSLFIAEILFGTLMLASLGPVVVSAVVALLTTHVLNGSDSLLYTVHLTVDLHAREYVMIVSTGLVAGLCGPLLMWLMTASHNSFLRLKLSPPGNWRWAGLLSDYCRYSRPRYGETAIASYNHFCSPRRYSR